MNLRSVSYYYYYYYYYDYTFFISHLYSISLFIFLEIHIYEKSYKRVNHGDKKRNVKLHPGMEVHETGKTSEDECARELEWKKQVVLPEAVSEVSPTEDEEVQYMNYDKCASQIENEDLKDWSVASVVLKPSKK